MTTAYTSLLGLALPVQGELSGTWGDTVNNSITSLLDTSVAGTTNVSTDTDVTLTTTTGAANTARQAILLFSGARTALRTVTAPAQSKIYTVINATTGGFSVKLVGVGPTTGVTIVAGESAVCAWNGSDFVKVSNTAGSGSFTNLTASGTVTFTGLTASQAVFTNASDQLVSNAITGTGNVVMSASPTLTGTVGGASLTLSSLTSGRVTYAGTSGLLQDSANLLYSGTDLTVYGVTVGRGASAVGTNTAVGASALAANTSGNSNTAIGNLALKVNTTGNGHVSVGHDSLALNTTGSDNTAVGRSALSANTTGSSNTGLGYFALVSNTTASNNTAVGHQAGYTNTTGEVTAVGKNALYGNTTAIYGTAVGNSALVTNTTGEANSALGRNALLSNSTGANNVGVGAFALQANTTADNNTAVGYQAGYSNTTSSYTTFIGQGAGYANTTGGNTVAIGALSLNANTTGTDNSAVGTEALRANTTGGNNTALGRQALFSNTTASNNTAVGYQAGYSNATGGNNTNIGYQAGYTNPSSGTNVFVGYQAGYAFNAAGQNSANTFIGYGAGSSVTSGLKNTILGAYSGNQGGLDIRTASGYIVLSDGDGKPLISTVTTASVALEGATPTTGTGITFPASQSASSNANTLDDYEEGAFTPTINGSSTDPTATYTAQLGRYIKVGRMVWIQVQIGTSAISGGSGILKIGGLPFTISTASGNGYAAPSLALINNITFSGTDTMIGGLFDQSTTTINLMTFKSNAGYNDLQVAAWGASATLVISGTYQTAN